MKSYYSRALRVLLSACALLAGTAAATPPLSAELEAVIKKNFELRLWNYKDGEKIRASYKRFLDKGDPVAQYLAATTFSQEDAAKAISYLEKSSAGGCEGAMTVLAMRRTGGNPFVDVSQLLLTAAERGEGAAQGLLFTAYEKSYYGLKENAAKAHAWGRLALRQTFSKEQQEILQKRLKNLELGFTSPELRTKADAEFAALSGKVKVVEWKLCGQAFPDAGLAQGVPDYLTFWFSPDLHLD